MDFEDSSNQYKVLSSCALKPSDYKKISRPQPGALAHYLVAKASSNPFFEHILHTFCPKTDDLINPYDTDLDEAYLKELSFRLAGCEIWYRKKGVLLSSEKPASSVFEDRFTPPWATGNGGSSAGSDSNPSYSSGYDHLEPSIRAHMETMRRISNARSNTSTGTRISSKPIKNPETDWLEINLYYADQHQTPVFGHPYEVALPDGTVRKGNLNSNGFARIEGIPKGNAKVEIKGDPARKAKLIKLYDQLEATLNKLVAQAAEDSRHQAEGNARINALDKGLVYVGAVYMAGADIVTDLWAFAKLVGQGLVKAELAYLDLLEDILRGDTRAVQKKLEAAKAAGIGTYETASETSEALYLLLSDGETLEILTNFVEDYWDASSGVDLTRMIAPMVIEILVTILTAGSGSPVLAANLGKAAAHTEDAADIVQQIVKVHKAVGQKAVKPTGTNAQVVIPIKKAQAGKTGTPDWPQVKNKPKKGELNLKKRKEKPPKQPIDPDLEKQLNEIPDLSDKQRQQIINAHQQGKAFEGDFQGGSKGKGNWNKDINKDLKPDSLYRVNGYLYETDSQGRVVKVSGKLKLEKADRNKHQQTKAGKDNGIKDGLKEDEGGHLIASLFKGAGEQINYSPMDGNFNKGAWKRLENKWAKALKAKPPKEVEVDIFPIYKGNSKRPDKFMVHYTVDGKKKTVPLLNVSEKKV